MNKYNPITNMLEIVGTKDARRTCDTITIEELKKNAGKHILAEVTRPGSKNPSVTLKKVVEYEITPRGTLKYSRDLMNPSNGNKANVAECQKKYPNRVSGRPTTGNVSAKNIY